MGTESVATLKFMAVHIRGVASAPGSRTSCLSKPWESGSSRLESKSSKTKKWKLQVIHALDFTPNSCSLPSLLGCGKPPRDSRTFIRSSLHAQPTKISILRKLTAGARGALARGLLAADGFHGLHFSLPVRIRHCPNLYINETVPSTVFLPPHHWQRPLKFVPQSASCKCHPLHVHSRTGTKPSSRTPGHLPYPCCGPTPASIGGLRGGCSSPHGQPRAPLDSPAPWGTYREHAFPSPPVAQVEAGSLHRQRGWKWRLHHPADGQRRGRGQFHGICWWLEEMLVEEHCPASPPDPPAAAPNLHVLGEAAVHRQGEGLAGDSQDKRVPLVVREGDVGEGDAGLPAAGVLLAPEEEV